MGRIQASTGLITGIPIQDTVDKLIAISAQPRDALVARQKTLTADQSAINDLMALALGVQFAIRKLDKAELFSTLKATSSDPKLLTATASSSATPGQYQFVPARLAQTHHALSSGVADRDLGLGGGSFSFRFGGQVNSGIGLGDLNAGAGVSRGKIKITDRNGASAVIDLRYVQTIDDVLAAINGTDDIDVTAEASGDQLVLHDNSGGAGNLRVQEVSGGTTAADLGLAGINVAANDATGQDIVELFTGLRLDQLRDGNGFSLRPELDELHVTFRDNSAALDIDLDPTGDPAPKTLGDIIDRINAADPARLQAQVSADGKRIELKDLTVGAGTFAVTSPSGGSVAEELGLTAAAVGDTITGSRVISGLKTTLLGTLNGGQGLGTLGTINLTDRSGATGAVNLASAESLDDVIDAINAAGLDITASYNGARNGLLLTDSSGSTISNLIVANGDATNTATKLGLAVNVAATTVNSGTLNRQVVSRNTLLSSYNGGQGVAKGTFTITNSQGTAAAVNLTSLAPKTIGDVIDAINALAINVEASINDAGDGIVLTDTAGGAGTLTVADSGTGRAAADLHLRGSGDPTTIDGSTTYTITLGANDSLDDLVEKINDLKGGASASVFADPSGSLRYHLSLLSGVTGKAGELLIDGSDLGLSFRDVTAAQDALLQVGGDANVGVLVSSAANKFTDVVPGLDVTLAGASTDPVTVTVAATGDEVATALQLFVDQYNKMRDKLATYTSFDLDAGTKGTLFGSTETLRLDNDLSRAISSRYFNDGTIRSLAELGVSIDDKGKLSLDKTKLQAKFDEDPAAVTEFFADEDRGFAGKLDTILESLVGENHSVLVGRVESIQKQLDDAASRIDIWNARLDRERERLMNEFFNLENIVASIKNNLNAISQIQFIPPLSSTSTNR
jgi:flagellar hook-associated protein 2